MENVLLVIHLLICIGLVILVLMQRSEGGALGMGGGGGGALMSGRGAADAIVKITGAAGAVFFLTSLGLTVLSGSHSNTRSVVDTAPANTPPPITAPATTDGSTGASLPVNGDLQRAAPLAPVEPTLPVGAAPAAAAGAVATTPPRPTATTPPAPKAATVPPPPTGAAPAPSIPLPSATPPAAPPAESGQDATPPRQKTGPEQ